MENKLNLKTEKKPNLNKIYPNFIQELAKVLDFGDEKYGVMNWKGYSNINELMSALMRHTSQLNGGELIDKQSGLSHLAHISANCMLLMWLLDNGIVSLDNLYYGTK